MLTSLHIDKESDQVPLLTTAYRVTQEDNVLGDRARATLIRGGPASVRGHVGP